MKLLKFIGIQNISFIEENTQLVRFRDKRFFLLYVVKKVSSNKSHKNCETLKLRDFSFSYF